ncbi:ABC transporter substrate-binding protein [Comamonas serinivorans]|uniref:ABC transporter substrate-binding protein n=1 Tax=Comamonas serinivorans TaxID=1082851 RepID=A0A1Y0ETJ0_9BURK|nr:tripartite tricarboxylate transporter substrate binding protein [Comamonas serinivorans]ARU06984.1 ABC transporter substrate-binding protein [Comamonas serinivorans]
MTPCPVTPAAAPPRTPAGARRTTLGAWPRTRRCASLVLASLLGCGLALAQATPPAQPAAPSSEARWPAKPIRIVVGFAPGGTTDVMARLVGKALSDQLGQPVVIDNKPGASGNIAVAEVARAAPDGHSFLVAPTTVETANPSLFKAQVNPARDLVPVAGMGKTQMYLVTKPGLPARNVGELVKLAQQPGQQLAFASAGTGTAPHLACELFKQATRVNFVHAPYRGAAPALQDVVAGQADFVCDPGIAFQHIRSGKVRLLAIVSSKRSPFFPEVPTVAEQGFAGADLDIWFGLWAPRGTPPELVRRMDAAVAKALADATVNARYGELGAETVALSTPAFKAKLAEERQLLSGLIERQNIRPD